MFDVMEPPPARWDPSTSRPVGTGAIKARSAVHRDRDWHRSVHVRSSIRSGARCSCRSAR